MCEIHLQKIATITLEQSPTALGRGYHHPISDRIGVTSAPELAAEEVSDELRVSLWNAFQGSLFWARTENSFDWRPLVQEAYKFLHWRLSDITYHSPAERRNLEVWFFDDDREWFEIYNLTEFVANLLANRDSADEKACPLRLLQFDLATRGVSLSLRRRRPTAITDETELRAVQDAIAVADRFGGARRHLTSAMTHLGSRGLAPIIAMQSKRPYPPLKAR